MLMEVPPARFWVYFACARAVVIVCYFFTKRIRRCSWRRAATRNSIKKSDRLWLLSRMTGNRKRFQVCELPVLTHCRPSRLAALCRRKLATCVWPVVKEHRRSARLAQRAVIADATKRS